MNGPRISSTPRYGGSFGPTKRRRSEFKMPRFFKRLFKFPQMDFETAVWEMTHLLIAPKKVFKSIYYQKQTRNSWHRPDPAFTYLLALFLLLTSLAWSLAYTPQIASIFKLAFMFVFVHFLLGSVLLSIAFYFLVGRLLGPGVDGLPGRRRQAGLFGPSSNVPTADALEFGYCFDVATRAFFTVWVWLYVIQYVLMPAIDHGNRGSVIVANSLYLIAGVYWSLVVFLGFNGLGFLHHTQLLLAPVPVFVVLWLLFCVGKVNLERWGVGWMFWGVMVK